MDVIATAELDATNLSMGQSVVYSIKELSNRETGRFFFNFSKVFFETFSEESTGFLDAES